MAESTEGEGDERAGKDDDGEELRSTEQRESQRWWWLETKRDPLLLLVWSVACRSSIPEVTCPPASLSRRTHCAIPLTLVTSSIKLISLTQPILHFYGLASY